MRPKPPRLIPMPRRGYRRPPWVGRPINHGSASRALVLAAGPSAAAGSSLTSPAAPPRPAPWQGWRRTPATDGDIHANERAKRIARAIFIAAMMPTQHSPEYDGVVGQYSGRYQSTDGDLAKVTIRRQPKLRREQFERLLHPADTLQNQKIPAPLNFLPNNQFAGKPDISEFAKWLRLLQKIDLGRPIVRTASEDGMVQVRLLRARVHGRATALWAAKVRGADRQGAVESGGPHGCHRAQSDPSGKQALDRGVERRAAGQEDREEGQKCLSAGGGL